MRRLAPAFLLLLALAACGRSAPEATGPARFLFDGREALDVLTERQDVALPPALGGNRFLSGWWPWKDPQGRVVLTPNAPEARLEIVSLGGGVARTLVLHMLGTGVGSGSVRVRAGGQAAGSFPLRELIEVPLPADLPLGRVPVDLSFDAGEHNVVAAALRPVLPEGEVRLHGRDLVQSGDSLVDLVRPAIPGARLVGTFVPPSTPQPGQRFEIILEREDRTPIRHFLWTPSLWNRWRGSREVDLPLGDAEGLAKSRLVRVRLLARGAGPAGRWEGLELTGGADPVPAPVPIAPSPAPPPRLVILYVMDALRADAVGHLGGPADISPVIDRLAREGTAFLAHRSVAPNTLPSTKALFTGRAFVSRGGWKLDPGDGQTLAELFRGAGYHTGLFSGNVYVSPAYQTDRGFEHTAPEVLIEGYAAAERPPHNDNAARANAAALAWLRSLPPGSKAFLYLHVIHPHNPYDPPEPQRSRWTAGSPSRIEGDTETLTAIQHGRRATTPDDRRRLRGLYDGSFAYADDELGRFLAAASSWAPPGETLVAVTADHGEEHFDHGGVLHGFTVYEEMLRIPAVFWSPGRVPARQVKERTSTLDLHAALRALCGLPAAPPTPVAARREGADDVHLAAASSVKGGIYTAVGGRWKVVWAPRAGLGWGQGEGIGRGHDPEALFDLEADPKETVNRAGHGDLAAAWVRARLLAWIESQRDEGDEPADAPVDPETLNRLRALGYVN
jgi:arylsulfatase A-like enzyme